jgi:TetR/AcrR family transcriptional regulator, transcriptional repressor for nem operon
MRYQPDHKQKTRRRVLEEATKAIRRQGPHRLGIARVMKQAGLTHGGFYAHFSSKDALVSAAIAEMFDGTLEGWSRETRGRSAEAGLAAYIESYLSPGHRDTRSGGCPMAALASELPRLAAPSRTAFAAGVRRLTDAIAAQLERLGQEKPAMLASSVMAELVGGLLLARCEPDRERSDAILAAARQSLLRRLGLRRVS